MKAKAYSGQICLLCAALTLSFFFFFPPHIFSQTSGKRFGQNAAATETPLGYPFLVNMNCPKNMVVGEGPTWRSVTVGKSSLDELEEVYGIRFQLQEIYDELLTPLYKVQLTASGASRYNLPQNAYACILDGKIVAIYLSVRAEEKFPGQNLRDWIADYGQPELVTWADNDWGWRMLLWPKEGVALLVGVLGVNFDQQYAIVNAVYLLPKATDYTTQWPYSSLRRSPPDVENDSSYPTIENPFDFGAMMSTLEPTLPNS